jgi:hypothetical protein
MFDNADVINSYTWQQVVEDGSLVEIFKNWWPELSGGKPILATAALFADVSLAGLHEIWNDFVSWLTSTMPTLPEDRLFSTTMNGETVWLIPDGTVFTMMYPHDY